MGSLAGLELLRTPLVITDNDFDLTAHKTVITGGEEIPDSI
jgi:hypothetical protein